jgi:hypothetical protein
MTKLTKCFACGKETTKFLCKECVALCYIAPYVKCNNAEGCKGCKLEGEDD